jgi:hypothetical protein
MASKRSTFLVTISGLFRLLALFGTLAVGSLSTLAAPPTPEELRELANQVSSPTQTRRVLYRWGSGTSSRNLITAGDYTQNLFNYFSNLTAGVLAGGGIYAAGSPLGATEYCYDDSHRLIEVVIDEGAPFVDLEDRALQATLRQARHTVEDLKRGPGGYGIALMRYDRGRDWYVIRDRPGVHFREVHLEGQNPWDLMARLQTQRRKVQVAFIESLAESLVHHLVTQRPLQTFDQIGNEVTGLLYFRAGRFNPAIANQISRFVIESTPGQLRLLEGLPSSSWNLPAFQEAVLQRIALARNLEEQPLARERLQRLFFHSFGLNGHSLSATHVALWIRSDLSTTARQFLANRLSTLMVTPEAAENIRRLGDPQRAQILEALVSDPAARSWVTANMSLPHSTAGDTERLFAQWERLGGSLNDRLAIYARFRSLLPENQALAHRIAALAIRSATLDPTTQNWAHQTLPTSLFPEVPFSRIISLFGLTGFDQHSRWTQATIENPALTSQWLYSIFNDPEEHTAVNQSSSLFSLFMDLRPDDPTLTFMLRRLTLPDPPPLLSDWFQRIRPSSAHFVARLAQIVRVAYRSSPRISLMHSTLSRSFSSLYSAKDQLRSFAGHLTLEEFSYAINPDFLANVTTSRESLSRQSIEFMYRLLRLPDGVSRRPTIQALARQTPSEVLNSYHFQGVIDTALTPEEQLLFVSRVAQSERDALRREILRTGRPPTQLSERQAFLRYFFKRRMARWAGAAEEYSGSALTQMDAPIEVAPDLRREILLGIGAFDEIMSYEHGASSRSPEWLRRQLDRSPLGNLFVRDPSAAQDLMGPLLESVDPAFRRVLRERNLHHQRDFSAAEFGRLSEAQRLTLLSTLNSDGLIHLEPSLLSDPSPAVRELAATRLQLARASTCGGKLTLFRDALHRGARFLRTHRQLLIGIGIYTATATALFIAAHAIDEENQRQRIAPRQRPSALSH